MSAYVVVNIIVVVLVFSLILMASLLVKNMQESIYRYRNVTYIAGILFYLSLFFSMWLFVLTNHVNDKELTLKFVFDELVEFPQRFSFVATPFFAVIWIFFIVSNIALIIHEGPRLKNLLGALMGIVFVGSRLVIQVLTPYLSVVHDYLATFLTMVVCYVECFFMGTVIMAYIAAKKKPGYDKDFIIILGCSIDKKGGLLPLLKDRTNRAIRYAWDQEIATGKNARYVPSGGQGPNEVMSEGSAMELYLLSHGAEYDEVFPEKKSTNTYENFLFSKQIIDEINPEAKIGFVTTNYHMFRSGLLARKAGIDDPEGTSSKTKWYFWPNGFLREFVALLVMKKEQHIIAIAGFAVIFIIVGIIAKALGF